MFGAAHVLLIAHSAHVRATILDSYLIEEMLIDLHFVVFQDDCTYIPLGIGAGGVAVP